MAIVRVRWIPPNRHDQETEVEVIVRGFRGATAVIARDLRRTASREFRNEVMRRWAECGKDGGFAIKEKYSNTWHSFEYVECGAHEKETNTDRNVRKALHARGFHQYCNQGVSK